VKHHNVERFFGTARERYHMLLRRRRGETTLTKDPIFAKYRFCNVFREDDKVTAWMRENLTKPLGQDHERQVRAAVVFRWFNKIETGELLKPYLLGEWRTMEATYKLKERAANFLPILGAAYMIKSPPGKDKVTGLMECIRKVNVSTVELTALNTNKLEDVHKELCSYEYLGPFMAYQMVCDLRYAPLLENAVDVNLWTAPGPGSARGMGRVAHDNVDAYRYSSKRDIPVLIERMQDLLLYSRNTGYWPSAWPKWELSTVQHWLCEHDKYERARTGEGEPKQLYRPAGK
jgi:hypothetical protein